MKILWHKHNLIISFSVGSGHHDKYLYEIPQKYLSGWRNLQGKIMQLNVITSLIWDFFSIDDLVWSQFKAVWIFS